MQRRFLPPGARPHRPRLALCPLLLLFIAPPAAADEGPFVFGEGVCPDPRALEAEVVRLTPRERRGELSDAVRVNVADRGDSYRVTLVTSEDRQDKSFTDPNRDCEKRARFAAVFIVVTLFPPELDLEPQEGTEAETELETPGEQPPAPGEQSEEPRASDAVPPPEVPPPSPPQPEPGDRPPPVPSREPPFDPIARVELALEGHLAPRVGESVGVQKLGGALLAVLGRGGVLLTLGVGYTLPTDFDAGLVRARMSELPARVGVRFPWHGDALGLALDLSLTGARRQVQGSDAVVPNQASSLALGARVDSGLWYRLTQRLRLLGGVHATLEPDPSELRALPYGRVGHMPWLWLGARVGFGVAL